MKVSVLAFLPLLLPLAWSLPTAGTEKLGPRKNTIFSERHRLAKRSNTDLNELLSLIVNLFPVNIIVENVSGLITASEKVLAAIAGIDTTENDLTSGNCGDVTIIFSRGTTETGNVGVLVGPSFFEAVTDILGGDASLAVQGVEYDADIPGFLEGGDTEGSQKMADLVTQAFTQCPSSKIVMSGYSQGGQLVHNAAALLPASTMAEVSSVVVFGDPNDGEVVTNADGGKTLVICHDGDNICDHGDLILLPHLTYAKNADEAASFVVASAGSLG
ncbi:Cutinase [Zalerion maritima]|uniref:Cutinase n=1 Tax=Zalerion maritima TaxID=339359 RepID=A0AAD5WQI0_9PEZI|nr:Cutinase [Zalerion maritima]